MDIKAHTTITAMNCICFNERVLCSFNTNTGFFSSLLYYGVGDCWTLKTMKNVQTHLLISSLNRNYMHWACVDLEECKSHSLALIWKRIFDTIWSICLYLCLAVRPFFQYMLCIYSTEHITKGEEKKCSTREHFCSGILSKSPSKERVLFTGYGRRISFNHNTFYELMNYEKTIKTRIL